MQNAVSSQKQSMTIFGVANAQKQGVIRVECIEASSTTMFQEWLSSKFKVQSSELAFSKEKAFLFSNIY